MQRGSGAAKPSDEGGADHAHQCGLQVLTGSAGNSAGRATQPHDDSAASQSQVRHVGLAKFPHLWCDLRR